MDAVPYLTKETHLNTPPTTASPLPQYPSLISMGFLQLQERCRKFGLDSGGTKHSLIWSLCEYEWRNAETKWDDSIKDYRFKNTGDSASDDMVRLRLRSILRTMLLAEQVCKEEDKINEKEMRKLREGLGVVVGGEDDTLNTREEHPAPLVPNLDLELEEPDVSKLSLVRDPSSGILFNKPPITSPFEEAEDMEKRKKEENAREAWQRAAELRDEIVAMAAQAYATRSRPVMALGRVLGSQSIFHEFNQEQLQHAAWLAAHPIFQPVASISPSVTQLSNQAENAPMIFKHAIQDSNPGINTTSDGDGGNIFPFEI